MNHWTVPLRLSLSAWLLYFAGVANFTMHRMVPPDYQIDYKVTSVFGLLSGIVAIWCWGRK